MVLNGTGKRVPLTNHLRPLPEWSTGWSMLQGRLVRNGRLWDEAPDQGEVRERGIIVAGRLDVQLGMPLPGARSP